MSAAVSYERVQEHLQVLKLEAELNGHVRGPPCQAYSLAGRPRKFRSVVYDDDPRHELYREYLKILANVRPAAFVMGKRERHPLCTSPRQVQVSLFRAIPYSLLRIKVVFKERLECEHIGRVRIVLFLDPLGDDEENPMIHHLL